MKKFVYYILNEDLVCEAYYFGGFLSFFLSKLHFKLLCLKYPYCSFILRKSDLFGLIEYYEEFNYDKNF